MEFDAIISDYKMPNMDGLDFLEVIRSMGYDIPFIIFTGKAGKKTALEAMKLGADHFVMKGGDPRKQYQVLAEKVLEKIEERGAKKTRGKLRLPSKIVKGFVENSNISAQVSTSILNSKLLEYWLKRNALRNSSVTLGIDNEEFHKHVERKIDEKTERKLNELVDKLRRYKKLEDRFLSIFEELMEESKSINE